MSDVDEELQKFMEEDILENQKLLLRILPCLASHLTHELLNELKEKMLRHIDRQTIGHALQFRMTFKVNVRNNSWHSTPDLFCCDCKPSQCHQPVVIRDYLETAIAYLPKSLMTIVQKLRRSTPASVQLVWDTLSLETTQRGPYQDTMMCFTVFIYQNGEMWEFRVDR